MNRAHDSAASLVPSKPRAPGRLARGLALGVTGLAILALPGCWPGAGYTSSACEATFGGGAYHDTYFRTSGGVNHLFTGPLAADGSGGTLPSTVDTFDGYQACDYSGSITSGACLDILPSAGELPMINGGAPYCQQFTDGGHGMLDSIVIYKSHACAPTFQGHGAYHDTYFRDSGGTNHAFTGASAFNGSGGTIADDVGLAYGYQVCDYSGAITGVDCLGLTPLGGPPMINGSGPYCQEFTDGTFDVLDSMIIDKQPAPVPFQCEAIGWPGTAVTCPSSAYVCVLDGGLQYSSSPSFCALKSSSATPTVNCNAEEATILMTHPGLGPAISCSQASSSMGGSRYYAAIPVPAVDSVLAIMVTVGIGGP